MPSKKLQKFYLFSTLGTLLASVYPLYMGVRVISDFVGKGSVDAFAYPKYVIPYTPICIALLLALAILPLAVRFFEKFAMLGLSLISLAAFFAAELWFEKIVVFDGSTKTSIESWQVFMCVATPEALQTVGNVLIGEYSPSFKLHFYFIAVIVILAVLNCIIGFALMIKREDASKRKALVLQAISAALFIGLCIFACFTAFFRTGQLQVSFVSALLMSLFFITFGITFGVFVGSFLYRKGKGLSLFLPSVVAVATTFLMYVGELLLLNGSLYQFGSGFFFAALGVIPFALVDLLVILLAGVITYWTLDRING